ncbi:DUF3889 domain-containing protein [Evansella clarkii]|uniref:DUF3889 domain-containing protein n=1 Tax=Evansella clarkii TaxID=79879 RepID=UPI000B436D34|nr:DUF3889 domain-containing protein [Evansella clarkii]
MKKNILWALALLILVSVVVPANFAQAQDPEYAKWGKLAIERMMEEYPGEDVKDYDYQGKVLISDVREQFNFLFTLEDGSKVRVYVLVDRKKDELIDIHLEKGQ